LLRAQAMSYRDANDPRLCPLLRGVKDQAKQTRFASRVALTLENACPSTP
jgi:hypothetical protein